MLSFHAFYPLNIPISSSFYIFTELEVIKGKWGSASRSHSGSDAW
jgi:hypothetical protein